MYQGVISGFHREVAEYSALLGYYAASSGNFLPMHQVLMVVKRDTLGNIRNDECR
jgi:hypothetical protein